MGYMNSTTYDGETNIARVGPGARWGAVYDTLAKDGIAVVGGRVTSVGVAGLILGGGNSFHSGKHGFACNNVQAYELVLGNGTVISVTEHKHPDLFRGLCGGSGNLGIATRFDMKTVPLKGGKERPYIWGGGGIWPYENTDLIDRMVDIAYRAEEDPGSSVFCGWTWVQSTPETPFSSACLLHQVDDEENPPLLKSLMDTPGSLGNTWRSAPISNFTDEVGAFVQHHKQNVWGSSSFKADPRVMRFAVKQHKKLADKLSELFPDDHDASALLTFQPLTSPIIAHGANRNVLGLESDVAKGPGMFTLLVVQAGSKENLELARPHFRAMEKEIDDYAKSVRSYWKWTYLNYVDFSRDPVASYGSRNMDFLHMVAKAYDPQKVFQDLRVSGHKLP
ncbi:FAD binding domain-containing protein [Sarocladium implicatum]|nr:FAD binding domain-containing protein [Sarocladium implicatum]